MKIIIIYALTAIILLTQNTAWSGPYNNVIEDTGRVVRGETIGSRPGGCPEGIPCKEKKKRKFYDNKVIILQKNIMLEDCRSDDFYCKRKIALEPPATNHLLTQ